MALQDKYPAPPIPLIFRCHECAFLLSLSPPFPGRISDNQEGVSALTLARNSQPYDVVMAFPDGRTRLPPHPFSSPLTTAHDGLSSPPSSSFDAASRRRLVLAPASEKAGSSLSFRPCSASPAVGFIPSSRSCFRIPLSRFSSGARRLLPYPKEPASRRPCDHASVSQKDGSPPSSRPHFRTLDGRLIAGFDAAGG